MRPMPSIRFVPIKNVEQQVVMARHQMWQSAGGDPASRVQASCAWMVVQADGPAEQECGRGGADQQERPDCLNAAGA
jgi:hypothetical protein